MKYLLTFLVLAFTCTACNTNPAPAGQEKKVATPSVKEEDIVIKADSVDLKSVIAYSDDTAVKKPIVIIVPEWWGLTDYVKSRAKQLAEAGYLAIGLDMYGNGKVASDPATAQAYAGPFYKNAPLAKSRLAAALAFAKNYAFADTGKTAAIGYCFGGSMVLNSAKLGLPVNGVVSFHGGLAGVAPDKNLLKAQVLVCHGAADKFVSAEEVATFKKQMDSVGATYSFKSYPDATHAFTNPAATETGKKFNMPITYNAAADTASWNDMQVFFHSVFK